MIKRNWFINVTVDADNGSTIVCFRHFTTRSFTSNGAKVLTDKIKDIEVTMEGRVSIVTSFNRA